MKSPAIAAVALCLLAGCSAKPTAVVPTNLSKPMPPTEAEEKKSADTKAADSKRAAMPREDFKKLVLGKTPDQVVAAVGKPDGTQDQGSEATWYYDWKTKDSLTDKVDRMAQVIFKDGRVSRVNF